MILAKLRNASNSLPIKIIFGAIICSFCLWGVGDVIRNYSSTKPVLTVGESKVTVDEFLREYDLERQNIRNRGSRPLSDEELKHLDIKQMVLDRLTQSLVVANAINKLNIVVSQRTILSVIHSLPEFQRDGVFSGELYAAILQKAGLSEPSFLYSIQEHVARSQLIHPVIAGYKLPKFIKEMIAKEFDSKNEVLVAKIDLEQLKYDSKVDDDTLKQYYMNNQEKYKREESRDVAVLVIDHEKLAAKLPISEDDVQAVYENTKDSYVANETRDFTRFEFENMKDATAAWKRLARGEVPSKIVKKFMAKMMNLQQCEKADFPPEVGEDLFKLKRNKVSSVYPISGKCYVYKLTKINLPKQKSESEIKAAVKAELQKEKLNSPEFAEIIRGLRNKVDDDLGSGRPIDDVSKEIGMQLVEIKGTTKRLGSPDLTKLIQDEETRTDVLGAIFTTDEQQASPIIPSRAVDSIEYVVASRKIDKEAVPEFSTVRQVVMRDFILGKRDKMAIATINDILGKNKEAAKEVAKMKGVKSFKFSKMDVISHSKNPSPVVAGVLQEIPNANVVLNIVSALRSGEAMHYKLSDTVYIIVAIGSVERGNASQLSVSTIDGYLDSCTERDAPQLIIDAVKRQIKVKVYQKRIDETAKRIESRSESD
ncbi:MAG: SurA N-terminal domain-containing protein [Holosporales bacterium]|jgi:peptidyl-prolyl cis-trans isomerase D|nr:SurA N-terminal domain-containing protein [Holosporales bacterium]